MRNNGFLERHWKKLVALLYVGLIFSLSIIGFYVSKAPMKEEFVEDDEVIVKVKNESNRTMNLTVKMEGDSLFEGKFKQKISSFGTKMVEEGEIAKFETQVDSSFDNFPFDILVYETNDMDDPIRVKGVRLTVGYKTGNQNEFEVTVS